MKDLTNKATDGTRLGQSSADPICFFGVSAAVTQPQLSATAAIATTAAINSSISSSCFGFTSAQATGIILLLNALRAQQVTLGLAAT